MNRTLALLLSLSAIACSVSDGDLAHTAALTGLDLTASEDALTARQTTLTGTIGLGYTSPLGVDLEIRDGGLSLYRSSMAADALTLDVNATLDLPYHSINHLVAEATYNGQSISQTLTVDVPEPIATVSLTASEDLLTARQTTLTGTVTLGYMGGGTVDVRVMDDGVEVYRTSADGAALTIPLDQTIDLVSAGVNTLTLEATYDGATVASSVDLTLPSSLTAITELAASTDTLDERLTHVTAGVDLGYTSAGVVDLRLLDNSMEIWRDTVDASALSFALDIPADLRFPGVNALTLEAAYDGTTLAQSVDVTVAEPLLDFAFSRSAVSVSQLAADVSGDISLGYMSNAPAVLSLYVNGQSVVTRTLDASASTSLPFSETLPLGQEGVNTLEARVTYDGASMSGAVDVTVPVGVRAFALGATPSPTSLAATVTGTGLVGYTSMMPATVDVFVEGALAWSGDFDVSADPNLSFDAPISLPHDGGNDVVAELHYGETTLSDAYTVMVPDALQGLVLTPDSANVDVFESHLTGSATVGYLSDSPAVLDISVNGANVYSEAFDVSTSAAVALDVTLPLSREGDNDVVARLTYAGADYAMGATVAVEPAPADFVYGNWNSSLVDGVSYTWTDRVTVNAPTGWTVESLRSSTDGGLTWDQASLGLTGDWTITVLNPDIGTTGVLLAADLMSRGVVHTTLTTRDVVVDPVFNCNPASMVPTTEMIQNNRTEVRTLIGYFGDPAASHTISFVIDANVPQDGVYTVGGTNVSVSPFAIDTQFIVDRLQCNRNNNNSCQLDYNLEMFVDGQSFCARNRFGRITRY